MCDTALGPTSARNNVYPSGFSRATAAAARVPPAPGRFSTISGWPLANCGKPLERLRERVSAAPPAPTGTSNRTGRSGHCAADWAKAATGAHTASARTAMISGARRVNDMGRPSLLFAAADTNDATAIIVSAIRLFAQTLAGPPPAGFTLRRSLGLDVGGPDDLGPFLGFLGEELAVFGRRERKRRVAEVGNPRPNPGIGEAGVDLAIEPVDDLDGRVARRAKALGPARLETRHEFRDGRHVRQRVDALGIAHAEGAQPSGPDVSDRRSDGVEGELHLTAQEVVQHRPRAAI